MKEVRRKKIRAGEKEVSIEDLRIVLVRSQGIMNIGSVARAMKNAGLTELALVDPAALYTPMPGLWPYGHRIFWRMR